MLELVSLDNLRLYVTLIQLCHAVFKENGLNISSFASEFWPFLTLKQYTPLTRLSCGNIRPDLFLSKYCLCLFVFLNKGWFLSEFRPTEHPQTRTCPFQDHCSEMGTATTRLVHLRQFPTAKNSHSQLP